MSDSGPLDIDFPSLTRIGLDDAWAKLGRAKEHFYALRAEIAAFEEANDYRIEATASHDADRGFFRYLFRVHDLEQPPARFGPILGDCIHNARAALDYLMVRLVAQARGSEPRDVKRIIFPIYSKPEDFAQRMSSLKLLDELAFQGYRTRLEELQTYNVGNASIWGARPVEELAPKSGIGIPGVPILGITEDGKPLFPPYAPNLSPLPGALEVLNELDVIDKHRTLHVTQRWLITPPFNPAAEKAIPDGFTLRASGYRTAEPLIDGAELGDWDFEVPVPDEDWRPGEMDMKRCFPIQVALDDSRLRRRPVLEHLAIAIWAVETTLHVFQPAFTSPRRPPLPVTTTLAPDPPS